MPTSTPLTGYCDRRPSTAKPLTRTNTFATAVAEAGHTVTVTLAYGVVGGRHRPGGGQRELAVSTALPVHGPMCTCAESLLSRAAVLTGAALLSGGLIAAATTHAVKPVIRLPWLTPGVHITSVATTPPAARSTTPR